MSETEQEQPDGEPEPEPVSEPEPEEEPEPDELEEEEDKIGLSAEVDLEPDTATLVAEQDKQLDRLQKHVSKRLSEILGDHSTEYNVCPVCTFYGTPGWMLGTTFSPDQELILKQIMGMRSPTDYAADAYSTRCLVCDGLGEVATGSRVAGFETAMCLDCDGKGWVATDEKRRRIPVVGPNGGAGRGLVAVPATPSAPPPPADEPPEAAELRAMGYLVMAPPTLST
ncbi:MAG TPA: hypothetical protein VH279_07300 [Solirubrobacteraceae bacterium]|nr:hypothetical protein [Solirubrobacteraceae bacterium]